VNGSHNGHIQKGHLCLTLTKKILISKIMMKSLTFIKNIFISLLTDTIGSLNKVQEKESDRYPFKPQLSQGLSKNQRAISKGSSRSSSRRAKGFGASKQIFTKLDLGSTRKK